MYVFPPGCQKGRFAQPDRERVPAGVSGARDLHLQPGRLARHRPSPPIRTGTPCSRGVHSFAGKWSRAGRQDDICINAYPQYLKAGTRSGRPRRASSRPVRRTSWAPNGPGSRLTVGPGLPMVERRGTAWNLISI
jgi:hypothetical protein